MIQRLESLIRSIGCIIRNIGCIVRVEFKRQLSSPTAWFFFLVLPVLFTASVGAGLSGPMNAEQLDPEEIRTQLYVVQRDRGPLVDGLTQTLESLNFALIPVNELSEDQTGLVIPPDFSDRILSGDPVTLTLRVESSGSSNPVIEQSIRAAQGRVGGAALVAERGVEQARSTGLITTDREADAFFRDVLLDTLKAVENPPVAAKVRWPKGTDIHRSTEDRVTSQEHASAGQIVTWVQITLLGIAETLVNERQEGTLKRMLIAPAPRAAIFAGKLFAGLSLGLVQMSLLFLTGRWVFGVDWGRDPWAVAGVSFAFALATAGLGIVLATFVKTRGQASSIVVGLAMSMSALGGAWYPLEITPPLYQKVVQVLPSNWAMRAYNAMLAQSAVFSDVAPHIGALLGFAALFITLGIIRFQKLR